MSQKCGFFSKYCNATVGDYDLVKNICHCVICLGQDSDKCPYNIKDCAKLELFEGVIRNRCRECIVNSKQKEK